MKPYVRGLQAALAVQPKAGECYWDWRLRAERIARFTPEPQVLDDPIPPTFGPCGEGTREDLD